MTICLRSRLLGIALGLGAAAGILGWQQGTLRRRPSASPGRRVLPENEGAIQAVALHYSPEARKVVEPAYRAFLSYLPQDVRLYVVTPDDAAAEDFARLAAGWHLADGSPTSGSPARIRYVRVGAPITIWCKDRFLVAAPARQSDCTALLCPRLDDAGWAARDGDSLVGPRLAQENRAEFEALRLQLHFDAGDILATREHLFVGEPLYAKNEGRTVQSRDELRRTLSRVFGRRVVWLGERPGDVPDHHLGMYLAPVDERTVLVGDAELGRRLWPKARAGQPGRNDGAGEPDFSPEAIGRLRRAAAQLTAEGFRVVPLPLVPFHDPKTFITYTNAVFETRDGERIVYMPWYDWPPLDEPARTTYVSLGYRVRPVPVRTLYPLRGTIGCLTNVLARGPAGARPHGLR